MEVDPDKVVQHLKEKWKGRFCAACGGGPWEVQPRLFQLVELTPGYIDSSSFVIPLAPITCKNCGNTVLVNAVAAGLTSMDDLNAAAAEARGD